MTVLEELKAALGGYIALLLLRRRHLGQRATLRAASPTDGGADLLHAAVCWGLRLRIRLVCFAGCLLWCG